MIKEVCDVNEIRAPSMVTGAAAARVLLLVALPCLIIQASKCCGS